MNAKLLEGSLLVGKEGEKLVEVREFENLHDLYFPYGTPQAAIAIRLITQFKRSDFPSEPCLANAQREIVTRRVGVNRERLHVVPSVKRKRSPQVSPANPLVSLAKIQLGHLHDRLMAT